MPFRIVRNDITCMQVDAIVNTANPMPIYSDGTDRAIYEKADAEKLLKLRKKIGVLKPGEAAVTSGLNLPAKYIIHSVSPVWRGGDDDEIRTLRLSYRHVLELARKKRCKSIAVPLLASGSNGFPKEMALDIALDSFREFLRENSMEIILTIFDKESLILSEQLNGEIESYIDDHYVEARFPQEYLYAPQVRFEETAGAISSAFAEEAEIAEAAEFDNDALIVKEADRPGRSEAPSSASGSPGLQPMSSNRSRKEKSFMSFVAMERSMKSMEDSEDSFQRAPSFPNEAQQEVYSFKRANYTENKNLAPKNSLSEERSFDEEKSLPVGKSLPLGKHLDELLLKTEDTFQQYMLRVIKAKGMKNVDVYTRANLDRKLFSKIKSNENYNPRKNTALALCIGLMLNVNEAEEFLARAGYAFSPSSKVDLIVKYFIEHQAYDVMKIDTVLYDHDLPMLSSFS